jgi:hypothetical protein
MLAYMQEKRRPVAGSETVPDLPTQLEDLLTQVIACERRAALEDRIDLAVRLLRENP